MTKKQVWLYRCDFCRKAGRSGGHMKNHEAHCTANPNRRCRFHLRLCDTNEIQPPMSEIIACIDTKAEDLGLAKLRIKAHDCPVCILAAIRQSGVCKWNGDPENPPRSFAFNFDEEMKKKWAIINEAEAVNSERLYW